MVTKRKATPAQGTKAAGTKAKPAAKAKAPAKASPPKAKASAKTSPATSKASAKTPPVKAKSPAKAKVPTTKATTSPKTKAASAQAKTSAKTSAKAKALAWSKPRATEGVAIAPPVLGIPAPDDRRARLLVEGERFGPATLSLQPLGPLRLPSGVIVACDPFAVHGPAFGRRLRPGSYDVVAAVASYPGKHGPGEQILAAVIVKVSPAAPARWEPATFVADDEAAPDAAGYVADSGVGCFMDAKLQTALAAAPTTWPSASDRALEHQLLDEHYVPTWGWASYQPDGVAPNCVAFLGGGAPTRCSYWGLDEAGAVACLLTDLEAFPADAWA